MLAAPAIVHAGNLMPVKALEKIKYNGIELVFDEPTVHEIHYVVQGGWTRYSGYDVLNILPSGIYRPADYIMRPASSAVEIYAR